MASAYQNALELIALLAVEQPELVPSVAALLPRLQPCRHSEDFASVVWFDVPYTLSPAQSKVVRQLWAAWQNGTPEVRQATLLLACGSDQDSIADVFKNDPAWGGLVVQGGRKGTYRLKEPAQQKGADA